MTPNPNPLEYIEAVARGIEAGYDLDTARLLAADALGMALSREAEADAATARADDEWTEPRNRR